MNIYSKIIQHANELELHPLMEYFRKTKTVSVRSFRFVPKMAFFVLGFKDILVETYKPRPKTSLEKSLNIHCQEDADHWLWFLDDLEKLGKLGLIDTADKTSSPEVLADLWSAQGYAVRKQTYFIISLLAREESAENKLVIIECLESAFSTFITNLTFMTKSFGLYQTLRYFGERHHFDESQHAMGSWFDMTKKTAAINVSGDQQKIFDIVSDIFNGFHKMFDVWLAEIEETPACGDNYLEARELALV